MSQTLAPPPAQTPQALIDKITADANLRLLAHQYGLDPTILEQTLRDAAVAQSLATDGIDKRVAILDLQIDNITDSIYVAAMKSIEVRDKKSAYEALDHRRNKLKPPAQNVANTASIVFNFDPGATTPNQVTVTLGPGAAPATPPSPTITLEGIALPDQAPDALGDLGEAPTHILASRDETILIDPQDDAGVAPMPAGSSHTGVPITPSAADISMEDILAGFDKLAAPPPLDTPRIKISPQELTDAIAARKERDRTGAAGIKDLKMPEFSIHGNRHFTTL
jgi:hypothetical protein